MDINFINFRPHIGQSYFTDGFRGKRILVLGESHYCLNEMAEGGRCYPKCRKENMLEDCHSQTEDVVDGMIYSYDGSDGSKYQQTFLCFERAVLGKVLTQKEREEFWEGVIFYNYLQFSQTGPRCHIANEDWEQSERAFRQLLEAYLPDFIIAWGARLYNKMPNWGGVHSLLTVDGDSTDVWTYTVKEKPMPMLKIHHPSTPSGKSREYWHKFIKEFLQL